MVKGAYYPHGDRRERKMQKASIFERIKAIFVPKSAPSNNTTGTAQSDLYVYITVKGKKFHYTQHCSSLHGAKTVKMVVRKAKKAGYTACDKCCYSYLHD